MSAVCGVCNYQRRCFRLYFSHLHLNVFLCSFCIWLPPPTTTQSCGFWAGKESAEPNTFIPVNNHPLALRWTVNTCTTRFPFIPWKHSNFQTWVACYRISFYTSGNRRNFWTTDREMKIIHTHQRALVSSPPILPSDDSLGLVVHFFPLVSSISDFIHFVKLQWHWCCCQIMIYGVSWIIKSDDGLSCES